MARNSRNKDDGDRRLGSSVKVKKAGRNAPSPTKMTHTRKTPLVMEPSVGCHVSPKTTIINPRFRIIPNPPKTRSYRAWQRYRQRLEMLSRA